MFTKKEIHILSRVIMLEVSKLESMQRSYPTLTKDLLYGEIKELDDVLVKVLQLPKGE